MKKIVSVAIILLASSSLTYGKCKLDIGPVPDLPDANVASLQEMLEARADANNYMVAAKSFVECSNGRGDRRTTKVLKRMHRLANGFSKANVIFSERVANNPGLLHKPEQMVAQK